MIKLSAKRVARQVAKRFIHPRDFLQLLRLARTNKRSPKVVDDLQLKVYSQILSADFLHYGYFDDPSVAPEALSLRDIQRAQLRYAELLLEQISDRDAPVFDVGCGMGGLLNLLLEKGFSPVALTPDHTGAEYIKKKYPDIPIIEKKLEEMPETYYQNFFGTVVTSESLQYLNLDKAIKTIDRILRPGGRWIVSDYFRINKTNERRSGHEWQRFLKKLQETDYRIVHQQDITKNVLPTLAYIHMWGRRAVLPVVTFSIEKLQKKHPTLDFLLQEATQDLKVYITDHLDLVSPDIFAREKKYMLLVIEKTPELKI